MCGRSHAETYILISIFFLMKINLLMNKSCGNAPFLPSEGFLRCIILSHILRSCVISLCEGCPDQMLACHWVFNDGCLVNCCRGFVCSRCCSFLGSSCISGSWRRCRCIIGESFTMRWRNSGATCGRRSRRCCCRLLVCCSSCSCSSSSSCRGGGPICGRCVGRCFSRCFTMRRRSGGPIRARCLWGCFTMRWRSGRPTCRQRIRLHFSQRLTMHWRICGSTCRRFSGRCNRFPHARCVAMCWRSSCLTCAECFIIDCSSSQLIYKGCNRRCSSLRCAV
mmetsp:Transcript_132673/g.248138  ORF Transcript_132673/g.248138 Transcript_132673/m.248138 type:complete len:279 (+) Transcript_132673:1780-2616(+)